MRILFTINMIQKCVYRSRKSLNRHNIRQLWLLLELGGVQTDRGFSEELGWESLYHKRWDRRLCHFIKVLQSRSPEYLFGEIPLERQIGYNLRDYEVNVARTNCFSNTYFYNTLYEWNLLGEEIKNSTSPSQFKSKLLKTVRP